MPKRQQVGVIRHTTLLLLLATCGGHVRQRSRQNGSLSSTVSLAGVGSDLARNQCAGAERSGTHHWRYNQPGANRSTARQHLHQLLQDQRVGLMLVGEPFRSPASAGAEQGCSTASASAQWEAHHSILESIVCPLERHGAHVNVLFTLPVSCTNELEERVRAVFGSRVIASVRGDPADHLQARHREGS